MEHFIRAYDRVLNSDFCEEVIRRFEASNRKFRGEVIAADGSSVVSPQQKRTVELVINEDPSWSDIESELQVKYIECVNRYAEEFPHIQALVGQLTSEPFRINKYATADFFDWHIDCGGENFHRVLAIQFYFNDVVKGGATEFKFQDHAVEAVCGRAVMFPTLWTYYHRGATVINGTKYICTNYVVLDPTQRPQH